MQELFDRATELAAAAAKVPEKLANREDAEKAADFVRQLTACIKKLEDAKKSATEPLLAEVKFIRDSFAAYIDRLTETKVRIVEMQTAYLSTANTDEVRSDYNSLTVLRETEAINIWRDELDLNLLKPYIDNDELAKFVRRAFKAGVTDIPGVQRVTVRKAVTK